MASDFTRDQAAAPQLERKARNLMEQRAGRTFDDAEWKHMGGRLAKFYAILRAWENEREQIRQPEKT